MLLENLASAEWIMVNCNQLLISNQMCFLETGVNQPNMSNGDMDVACHQNQIQRDTICLEMKWMDSTGDGRLLLGKRKPFSLHNLSQLSFITNNIDFSPVVAEFQKSVFVFDQLLEQYRLEYSNKATSAFLVLESSTWSVQRNIGRNVAKCTLGDKKYTAYLWWHPELWGQIWWIPLLIKQAKTYTGKPLSSRNMEKLLIKLSFYGSC